MIRLRWAKSISTFFRSQRDEVLRCLGDASSHVAGSLMDAADDLPIRRVGAAFRFQRAGGAVGLAGAVNDGFGLSYPRPLLGEGAPFTA